MSSRLLAAWSCVIFLSATWIVYLGVSSLFLCCVKHKRNSCTRRRFMVIIACASGITGEDKPEINHSMCRFHSYFHVALQLCFSCRLQASSHSGSSTTSQKHTATAQWRQKRLSMTSYCRQASRTSTSTRTRSALHSLVFIQLVSRRRASVCRYCPAVFNALIGLATQPQPHQPPPKLQTQTLTLILKWLKS